MDIIAGDTVEITTNDSFNGLTGVVVKVVKQSAEVKLDGSCEVGGCIDIELGNCQVIQRQDEI